MGSPVTPDGPDGPDGFVDRGAGRGASGAVDAAARPPAYVVAENDRIDAVAARFDVPALALIGDDHRPVRMPMMDEQRDLVPGEVLSIVVSLRSLAWMQEARIEDFDDGETVGSEEADESFEVPAPHPAFLRAFPGDLYLDEADEFAPFGTDEGFDARWSILRGEAELAPTTTLAALLTWELGDDAERVLRGVDETEAVEVDPLLVGVAFTLLWSTGRIDEDGRAALLGAIERQIARFGDDPRLIAMRDDVRRLDGRDDGDRPG